MTAAALCCQQARLLGGVQLQVRWAQGVLEDAYLAGASILLGRVRVAEA